MHAFDIRITGEVDDEAVARKLAGNLIGEMLAGGSRVHHASMNGQEIRVRVGHVEAAQDDAKQLQSLASELESHVIGSGEQEMTNG